MQLVNFKLCLLFVAVATGVMGSNPEKIVNGEYSNPTEIPYIVSLRTNGHHFCGGSIISYNHILTAAHCLDPSPFVPGKSYVVTGTTMRKYNGTIHRIRSYQSHPYFSMDPKYQLKYDIAIITVYNKIKMNEHQKIIRLPVSPVPRRSAGMSAGWGVLHYGDQRGSDFLKKVATTVMNGEECQKHQTYDRDTQSIVCSLVESKPRGGTCQGDSGGPLVLGNTVVGIVSTGIECATESPDIYTSVYFYKDWIQQTIRQSGVAGVTKYTPESDFYNKDKVKKVRMKYYKGSQSSSSTSKIAYYSYMNGEWYAVLY